MKYLNSMTDKEIIEMAKTEKIPLNLKFSREKTIEKLQAIGYLLEEEKIVEKIQAPEEKAIETPIKVEKATLSEELEFDKMMAWNFRPRSFYRHFVNKKMMRKFKKRYRFKKDEFRNINFDYEGLSLGSIKRRELETEIENSKFALGEGALKEIEEDIYFDRAPLPTSYFVDEIVLMPKNTTTLFAYWEIRDDTFKRLSEENHIVDNVVIKLMKNGHEHKKIIRHERIGSHYINEIDANESYEALIGYEDVYGNFIEIAHSTQAIAPNDTVSNDFELKWLTVIESPSNRELLKYEAVTSDEAKMVGKEDYIDGGVIRRLVTFGSSETGIIEEYISNPGDWGGSSFLGSSSLGSSYIGSSKVNK